MGERSEHILGLSTSLIPLIEHDDTARALMGANMQRQAVPLIFTEPPLVQSGMERKAAHDSRAMLRAHISGRVVSVTADEIVIKSHDGTIEAYRLKKYECSNAGTIIDQKPIVSVGQSVQAGDSIADAQSIKDGILSLGRNVLVAYMPWEGYNNEDGIVISDRLVKADIFTSVYIEKIRVEARHTDAGVECLTPDLPGKTEGEINHLDEHGVAKVGTWIGPTDILVGKLSPSLTDESKLMNLLEDSPVQWANTSSIIPAYIEGEVIRTQFFSRKNGDELPSYVEAVALVEIAMRREVKVGDKFAGRHGNKGVIAKIVPEADMPHLADGTPVDVILNPIGVPTRLSYGQILETHLGWAAHQLGQPVISPPYNGPNSEQIKELLSRAGLPENGMTRLFDGRTGRPYDMEVTVGYQYLMKLNHLVDDKIHARSIGPYSIVTQAPLGGRNQMGGQRLGEMEVWALEAYGAAHNLYEMMTVKSNATAGIPFYRRLAHGDVPVLEGMDGDTPTFKLLTNCLRGLGIDLTKDDEGVHICLASPEQIREWSAGEIGFEEIGENTYRFAPDVPNREAMGHIDLALPVAHPWFVGKPPRPIALLLDITQQELEDVLYFKRYIVIESASQAVEVRRVLTKDESETLREKHDFRVGIGGVAIRELLANLDLESAEVEVLSLLQNETDAKRKARLCKQRKLIRQLQNSGTRPEWMVMEVLPVVPKAMRPMATISAELQHAGKLATSDLSTLYEKLLLDNRHLKQLIAEGAPETLIHNAARSVQSSVNDILDEDADDSLQSLTDILVGRDGVFRSRLLGARMDYSGRSVIVP
ncbi:hypothetical protein IH992_34670, partial [Candidatus Poribacteria bacterium]|nr:hypothetical protein [Candidatus Poribacteria bacterium]